MRYRGRAPIEIVCLDGSFLRHIMKVKRMPDVSLGLSQETRVRFRDFGVESRVQV